ncbi:hypothetical protein KFE80_09130 [bacterium SCSIO 12696]|nr:hypothetical protein KFE80_09130 [bacterium SCSIO 12696]
MSAFIRYKSIKWSLLVILASLAGCSSLPTSSPSNSLSQQDLLSGEVLFGSEVSNWALPSEDILAVSDEMRQFLSDHTDNLGGKGHRLRKLMKALLDNGLMNLKYTNNKTLTAQETFEQRAGNCLAFTNLFVALARELGLNVYYQSVDVPPSWRRGGDFLVINQHVNVLVKTPYEDDYVVDFNLPDYSGNYETEPVSDKTAFAQYYSNLAVEYLENKEYRDAFLYLKKALLTDSRQSFIWINLGALYSRHGYYDHAEAAYLYAIKANRRDKTAYNNLANLYRAQGKNELFEKYSKKARYYRNANPYYYFWLAQQAYREQEYSQTLKHLQKAIAKKDDEHLFYYLRGLSYYQLGDKNLAKDNFSKAEEKSQLEFIRKRYRKKLEFLVSG